MSDKGMDDLDPLTDLRDSVDMGSGGKGKSGKGSSLGWLFLGGAILLVVIIIYL